MTDGVSSISSLHLEINHIVVDNGAVTLVAPHGFSGQLARSSRLSSSEVV